MITKYKILYNDVEVGILEVDDEKKLHRYTIDFENAEKVKGYIPLPELLLPKETDWIKPLPFYQNRLDNCLRLDKEAKVIGYFTDFCRLVKIEE